MHCLKRFHFDESNSSVLNNYYIYSHLLCISVLKVMPQGLVSTPLVASKEEVLYCFVLLEHVRLHPGLITHDNLLWLCEDVAIIECSSHLFRFIGKHSLWIII